MVLVVGPLTSTAEHLVLHKVEINKNLSLKTTVIGLRSIEGSLMSMSILKANFQNLLIWHTLYMT